MPEQLELEGNPIHDDIEAIEDLRRTVDGALGEKLSTLYTTERLRASAHVASVLWAKGYRLAAAKGEE